MKKFIFFAFFLGLSLSASAQKPDTTSGQGAWVGREIINGDTFYITSLRPVNILAGRIYKDNAERDKLRRYRRYAAKVYPYAVEAIELYDELQDKNGNYQNANTGDMPENKKRK